MGLDDISVHVLTLRELNSANGDCNIKQKAISLGERICCVKSLYIDNSSRSIVMCVAGRANTGRRAMFLQVRSMDSLDLIRSFSISEGIENLFLDFSHDYSNGIFVAFDCESLDGRTPKLK